ncbi:mandelate racemase/muconate lactonizing enzyme family protein [Bradyrhizobium sp. U87765 SZCCT0131]|uniref:mandelate racemase/muconate lactonizing enzyme family protein n=1 Tax=unclassified Bradyrhizobium TaxID=2631580 RepID=UPI001BA5D6BA|nr:MULTISPECIES: mandelate racemase/muconate lactonizing enzyme family protein [unclassified Bradyrhizobium]MBR1218274.1 mandelate racemase/muconate lactonizing enzyme family protein [Bradyrhizobium sp. U87765 SZCCT0131]MBR1260780.1 mandelate racemase/muconate lactonizing enzyme family protein [Bradyrhizobium sp. U87765 SZCCT0134]MBR1303772.1 mandelate racemase/muconate lactonizing enzyme family protein [Bradyrhizobium sp. U87765 SZCCT0110]MBR1319378.1 mandelate racemase/muconate lactonizing en
MQHAPFTIARLDAYALRIPFGDFISGPRATPQGWRDFDMVLVRAESSDGVVGWGECFAYSCLRPVWTAVQDMVFPLVQGRQVTNIADLNAELQFKLHIFGRYGIGIFAISGLDMALWDLAARQQGKSLADLIGGRRRDRVPAYASLVRYGEGRLAREIASRAVAEGYREVKLHEIAHDPIAAARDAVGPDVKLMTDVNCSWSVSEAEAILPRLKALDLHWVEEPIFPPEDFAAIARLQRFGVPLSAGENACTAIEFARLTEAVTYPQPSVTKVGGVTEFLKVVALVRAAGKTPMPHSPYFGPGYAATLQLAALQDDPGLFEFLYVTPEAWLDPAIALPRGGLLDVPSGPGLGFTPDPAILRRFQLH